MTDTITARTSHAAPTKPRVDASSAELPAGGASEASLLPRFVTLLTPLFAVAAGWIGSWVAQHTGAQMDQTQVLAFMVVAASSAIGAALKWLHGWQQHEVLVAQGVDVPRKRGPKAAKAAANR